MKLIYYVKRRFKQIVLPRIEGLPRITYLILEIATDNWNTDETDLTDCMLWFRNFVAQFLPRIEGLPRISYLILEIATDNWNTDETDLTDFLFFFEVDNCT